MNRRVVARELIMKRTSRLLTPSTDEVGWISTTDMFVVASCFLMVLAVASKRRANEVEGQLGSVTKQLEFSTLPQSQASLKNLRQ